MTRYVSIREIENWVEPTTFQRGLETADRGGILHRVRSDDRIAGEVEGHRAAVRLADPARASCSCRSTRKVPFCKHATAVLVVWSRSPESFRAGALERTPRTKEKGVRTPALEALERLLSELAESGLGTMTEERSARVRAMAVRLRDCGPAQLSTRLVELAGAESPKKFVDRLVDLVFLERSIRAGKSPANPSAADRAVSSVDEVLRRYREWREDPSAPSDLPMVVRFPACVSRSGRLRLRDDAGALLPLDCEDIPLRKLGPLLTTPGVTLFVRVRFEEGSLVARPLSVITDAGTVEITNR
jgi:hypothetical protein